MAFKSPGIYFTEIDNTEFTNPAATVSTTVAIIGFAKKGEVGVPTEITTYNDFKSTFGSPIDGQYAGLAVRSVLASGGTVLFTRIADESLVSKSNVVLKNAVEAKYGAIRFNSAADITVGTAGYENGKVYAGKVTDSSGTNKKTLILRAPSSGKFKMSSILKQLNEQLSETYAYTEYSKSSTIRAGLRNFYIEVSGKSSNGQNIATAKTKFGPYFVNVMSKQSGTSLATAINSAIETGTNPYQKLYFKRPAADVIAEAGSLQGINFDLKTASSKTFYLNVSINAAVNKIPVVLTPTAGTYITMVEMAEQISDALASSSISVQWCWNVADTEDPYFLFISTSGEDFDIQPFYDVLENYNKINEHSLFIPYFDETKKNNKYVKDAQYGYWAKRDTGYEGPVASGRINSTTDELTDDTAKFQNALKLILEKSVNRSFNSGLSVDAPATVSYNEDSNSFIFVPVVNSSTKLKAEGSVIRIYQTEGFGKFLFDDGSSAIKLGDDAATGVEASKKADNSGNIGKFVASGNGEAASKLKAQRNDKGQIELIEEGVLSAGKLEDVTGSYVGFSEIFGDTITEKEFAENNFSSSYVATVYGTGAAAISAAARDMVIFTAREVGEGSTDIGIEIVSVRSPIDSSITHSIEIYVNGAKKEGWDDVSYNPEDDNYFADLINEEPDNGGSALVDVLVIKNNTATEEVELLDSVEYVDGGLIKLGTPLNSKSVIRTEDIAENSYLNYDYSIGNNGVPLDTTDLFLDAMDPKNSALCNEKLYNWHILITPDNITEEVQDAAIQLCESQGDAIYIADPPQGLSRKAAVDWSNGKTYRSTALTSGYAATYWPWCKVYDSNASRYIWVMPSILMASLYCKVDNAYGPWYAPAGDTNGYLSTATDIEAYPNRNDRDELYINNRVNPIIMLKNGNIEAYGEKTCQRKNSTLTKIHTRRMLIALRKDLNAAVRSFIFQPTTADNIAKVNSLVTAIMEQYKTGGGVSWYKVVCDGSNNTSETLQQDILNVAVVCVPNGCIEQVEISLTLNKSAE